MRGEFLISLPFFYSSETLPALTGTTLFRTARPMRRKASADTREGKHRSLASIKQASREPIIELPSLCTPWRFKDDLSCCWSRYNYSQGNPRNSSRWFHAEDTYSARTLLYDLKRHIAVDFPKLAEKMHVRTAVLNGAVEGNGDD